MNRFLLRALRQVRRSRPRCVRGMLAVSIVALSIVAAVRTLAAQTPTAPRAGNVEIMLAKNALTAVNHGNITGNFTVLRDLGSESFRTKNSAASLSTTFEILRNQKIDLSPILMLEPQFTAPPAINQAGYLELVGFFPTRPLQVNFVLSFQRTQAGWVIDTVGVGTTETRPAANGPVAVPAPVQAVRAMPRQPIQQVSTFPPAQAAPAQRPQQPYAR
jgi:hypothetical protein